MDGKYEKISLGRPAVFYLPSNKINDPSKESLKQELHNFLLKEFGGYTVERGNIVGYWLGKRGVNYDESVRYTIAFPGKERIPVLERGLIKIAKELGEEAIYIETGEDSWLILPL